MYDIDELIEPRKKGELPKDPFAQQHKQVKKGYGETFQYDVLGQFHPGGDEIGKSYQKRRKGRVAHIEYMSPDKYFEKIDEGFKSRVPTEKLHEVMPQISENYRNPKLLAAAKKGNKFAMPFIEYNEGEFSGQEGRNRATMAKDLGVEKMPVVIIDKKQEYIDFEYTPKKNLKKNPFTYSPEELEVEY